MQKKLIWSEYQKDIFREIAKGTGDIIVAAAAGSSKTTSLVESVRYIPNTKSVLITAFNKEIQKELQKRVSRPNVKTRTFHSLGMEAITNSMGKVEVDEYKKFKIAQSLVGEKEFELCQNICQTVSFCQAALNDLPSKIEYFINSFGIDMCGLDKEDFISHVINVLHTSRKNKSKIDYDDMIYYVHHYKLSIGKYDLIFVDESQDLNYAQLKMVDDAKRNTTRMFFFGDPYQCIYKWRLADSSIIKEYEVKPTTKVLELPISYRCPKKVINLAQKVLPSIKYAPNANDGLVEDISYFDFMDKVKAGEVVLSRTNAPLIKCCLKLLRQGKSANILGKDIGDGLLYLIKKSGRKQLKAFETWLEKWKDSEIIRLKAKGVNSELTIDKYECLQALIEESDSIADLSKRIKNLFSDNNKDKLILFSSIHGFKGKEASTVYIFNWTLRYHPAGYEDPNPDDEERNLYYVAITRSKNNLYFVNK